MHTLKINPAFQALLWPLSSEEYTTLKESIAREGCRDAIVTWKNTILDGHNRYQICTENSMSFATASMSFGTVEEAKDWIDKNQAGRRNVTPDQMRVIRGRMYNRVKKPHGVRGKEKIGQNDPSNSTAKKLAELFGVSEATIKRDAKFAEQVDSNTELKQAIADKKNIQEIKREFVEAEREQKRLDHAKKIQAAQSVVVDTKSKGPFEVILADPPWQYDFTETKNREVENQYPTTTVHEIKSHKPNSADDAILFLWATAPKLQEALEVMHSWGFKYVTHAIWDKGIIGMGYWFRGQHELLLVGTKGKPGCPPDSERVSSIFVERRTQHSTKPQCVYKWIEQSFPTKTKLEMYCRIGRKGWSIFGNEV